VPSPKLRLALVVSHPIQYYVPLYQRLARREDLAIRVFYTWHAGANEVHDRGFGQAFAWDLPLTEGYDYELVPNLARDPGTHHFFGLRNPELVARVEAWRPDVVHVTGWAWHSHLRLLRALRREGVPVLFRGDSHLLDGLPRGPRWWLKRALLRRVYSWPSAFLVVGRANRDYYRAFGVAETKMFDCPHSIDVTRFAEPSVELERQAAAWRRELGIEEDQRVLLFAGKFEPKKQPVELARAFLAHAGEGWILLMVGGGALQGELDALARSAPDRMRLLPFQNQRKMPLVYRLGDVFVLPSAWGETWGLAVNEALACGRPVLVSDRVGCAEDVIDPSCGRVAAWQDLAGALRAAASLATERGNRSARASAARLRADSFDVGVTATATVEIARRFCSR